MTLGIVKWLVEIRSIERGAMKYRTKAIVLLMAMVFLTTGISVGDPLLEL